MAEKTRFNWKTIGLGAGLLIIGLVIGLFLGHGKYRGHHGGHGYHGGYGHHGGYRHHGGHRHHGGYGMHRGQGKFGRGDAKGKRRMGQQARMMNIFEQADGNRDGVISEAESAEVARNRFAEIDANGDGEITIHEIRDWHEAKRGERRRAFRSRRSSEDMRQGG